MKTREYKKVYLSKKGENRLKLLHPWIYESDVIKFDDGIVDGDIVDVTNEKDKYLGTGFYNSKSKIRVRIISRNTNDTYDYDFFKRRIKYAFLYRKTVMNDLNNFRLIFGEADGLPGLTVDKFNDVLVSQVLCLGIDLRKSIIFKAMYDVLSENNIEINGIYERNDVDIREKEGLKKYKGWYDLGISIPKSTTTIIVENDIKYLVDFENGQKTGYFLDQKNNRLLVRNIAKDKCVLDCCTHTGSFAMNAYLGGAKKVCAVDISKKALDDANINFKLNNMNIETKCKDVFDILKEMLKNNYKDYDLIILDPPAFTKSSKTIKNAVSGYQNLNYLAMKVLPRGGFLVTASCSHFASEEIFKDAIFKASIEADVNLKLVSSTGPCFDHPELIGVDETKYLKFFIFQII